VKNVPRVLVVGWDGATWTALKPWVDAGLMPNLKKMMEDGVWGELESVIPPVSPVAWPSFATGCNPGRHGVFGFQQFKKDTLEIEIPLGYSIREEKLWQTLSKNGKKSVVMNIQLTFPPDKIDGVIVSGVMAPEVTAHPKEIEEWLKKEGYVIEGSGHMDTPKKEFLQDLYRVTDKRCECAMKLMDKVGWDFFMILISGTDRVQHYLFGEIGRGKYGNAIRDYYIHLDQKLSELREKAGADVVIVMSDHGFCRQEKRVHINNWLEEHGYIKTFDTPENRRARRMVKMSAILKRSGISKIIVRAMQMLGQKPGKVAPPKVKIDYENSKAYTCGYYTGDLYLNRSLSKGEYERVQDEIVGKLRTELRDPKTGELICEKVWKKQEIYHGLQTKYAPDILILPKEPYWITGGFNYPKLIEPIIRETGRHHLMGMYVMSGAGVKKGERINARLIDLNPTILNFFGIKKDVDGKVLKDALKSQSA